VAVGSTLIIGQTLLIVLIVCLGVYVFVLRSVLTDRLAMLVLAAAGIALVAWPGLAEAAAHLFGIGRGTDLVFYLFIIFCLFRFVSSSAAQRRLERRLGDVVREQALRDAHAPEKPVDMVSSSSEAAGARGNN
jgi:small membrane protein